MGKTSASHHQTPRVSLYSEVTQRIISDLESGIVPWVQPWDSSACACGMPLNASTERRYSGINILILWSAVIARRFSSQRWLTYRQALALGGNVRAGERGTIICYTDRFTPNSEQERASDSGDEARRFAFLKRFTVFNVDQCEYLPDDVRLSPPPRPHETIIPEADALITATQADFRIGGSEAFYMPDLDLIRVPPQAAFADPINWYRTAFHELGHNAGTRIMPRGLWLRLVFRPSAARRFGIIR
ncbi:ArdC family protein, partial [Sphingobium boeckii]